MPLPNTDLSALFEAFAKLETAEEASAFLRDLATSAELEAFAERLRIAAMLEETSLSYREIAAATGASTTTIGRVAKFLRDEPFQGYRMILGRLDEKTKDYLKRNTP